MDPPILLRRYGDEASTNSKIKPGVAERFASWCCDLRYCFIELAIRSNAALFTAAARPTAEHQRKRLNSTAIEETFRRYADLVLIRMRTLTSAHFSAPNVKHCFQQSGDDLLLSLSFPLPLRSPSLGLLNQPILTQIISLSLTLIPTLLLWYDLFFNRILQIRLLRLSHLYLHPS